jgi:23S rRNA (guanosine2251-2'-O)-methyltransferase
MRPQDTENGSQLLPGRKPVLELVESDPERVDMVFIKKGVRNQAISQIIDVCRKTNVRFRFTDQAKLDALFPGNHQGVVARVFEPGFVDLDQLLDAAKDAPLPVIVALDHVQDPGNAGALARTLYALGGAGLLVPKDRSAYLGAAASKVSAGALSKLPTARVVNLARALDTCRDQGFFVYCAEKREKSLNAFTENFPMPLVLVLGGEEKGVRPGVAKRCDAAVAVPLVRDFDSLNVAQAGAALLTLIARQTALGKII